MKTDQRIAYMKKVVFPKMQAAFSGFDSHYNEMTCKTCHGDRAANGDFKMPNAKLPKLPGPDNMEGFKKLMAEKPKAVEFMGKIVKPQMAELLGLSEFNPATKTGEFSCYSCHTHD